MYYKEPLGKYNKDGIDITKYITNKFYDDKGNIVKVVLTIEEEDYYFNLLPYKNEFPLILTNVKILFCIPSIRYNVVKIIETNGKEQKYLLFLDENGISFNEFIENKRLQILESGLSKSEFSDFKSLELLTETQKHKIRRIICFNWLMCLGVRDSNLNKNNVKFESNLYVEPSSVFNNIIDIMKSKNLRFYYLNENISNDKNKVPKTSKFLLGDNEVQKNLIRDYFENSNELFYECIGLMIRDINPDKVKFELLKIVRKYNQDYIPWVNIVYERVLNAKNFEVSD